MGVFYALLLIPIIVQHFVVKEERMSYKKKNRYALAFFFAFLALLVMLRHESVGNDTRNYIHFFNKFNQMEWGAIINYPLEIGFSYFSKVILIFTEDPQLLLAIMGGLTIAMFYPVYRRLCIDSSLTIVLFCIMSTFVVMFSGIRQMLAIGIGLIAYEFTRTKKLVPFIIAVVVALLFHTSAFIIAFMYPLYHAKITKKWLYAVVPILTLTFIFNKQIFSALGLILERYTEYDATVTSTGAYTMLVLFILFAVFSFLIPEESLLDVETIGLRNFLLLSLVIQMFAPLHTLAMRMNYYYTVFIPLLIPKIIACRSKRWSQVAILGRHVMLGVFLVYFFISASGGGGLHVFPYHFFWETL